MAEGTPEKPTEKLPGGEGEPASDDKPWMEDVRLAVATVDESSKLARNLFTYLLTAGLYIAVAVAGTTDRDLLLNSPVELPILGTEVPLNGFYFLAPLLLVVFHLNQALAAQERHAGPRPGAHLGRSAPAPWQPSE